MSLWEYANPAKFMALSARILPILAIASSCLLLIGLFWGFFLTPADYKQGSTVKIIFLHVPSALMAINAWLMMLIASLIWLVRRHHVSALAAKAAAPIGVTMTLIAIATGAMGGNDDPDRIAVESYEPLCLSVDNFQAGSSLLAAGKGYN